MYVSHCHLGFFAPLVLVAARSGRGPRPPWLRNRGVTAAPPCMQPRPRRAAPPHRGVCSTRNAHTVALAVLISLQMKSAVYLIAMMAAVGVAAWPFLETGVGCDVVPQTGDKCVTT